MGLKKAFTGAWKSTLADQWKEIIVPDRFDEYSVVVPGVVKNTYSGTRNKATEGIISKGSLIYVPENTATFVFSNESIEEVISEPGGYEYENGSDSVFHGDGIKKSILKGIKDRIGYGGIPGEYKKIIYVSLREIFGLKFGTKTPLLFFDAHYGIDLEIIVRGTFSIKVIDPECFVRNYIPANAVSYSFSDKNSREKLMSEFLQSFGRALNILSGMDHVSQLYKKTSKVFDEMSKDNNVGLWPLRFGIQLIQFAVENIELSDKSKYIIEQYSENKMNLQAYEGISESASNISRDQKIAEGIKSHGLGNAGMVVGMNIASTLRNKEKGSETIIKREILTFDERMERIKKYKELYDVGIISYDEFIEIKHELF